MHYGVYALLPPFLAIVLAIITRNVFLALAVGILSGYLVIDPHPVAAAVAMWEGFGDLLQKGWVLKTLAFAIFVGAIIELIQRSGGVESFVAYLQRQKGYVTDKKRAELLPFFIGLAIFIESSITSLVAGTVARPLTDRFGTSREKLAYICDSTAAPVCTMFPLNAWGALLLGLIGAQIDAGVIDGEALPLLANSLAFNFYAFFSIALVLFTILKGIDFPAYTPIDTPASSHAPSRQGTPLDLLVPILSMLGLVVVALFITGEGNPLEGSGSTAVFVGVLGSVLLSSLYYRLRGKMESMKIIEAIYRGVVTMLPIAGILLLAFAIGDVTVKLDTGGYMAHFARAILNPALLPAGIFLLSALIAFATGTSWGTFSIMMPIAITMNAGMGMVDTALLPLAIAAVVSGGVFGDHASPISDTTIIAAMAAGCDLVAHVKTQLPWALFAAFLAMMAFLLSGWIVRL